MLADKQTDKQTDRRTDRQTGDHNTPHPYLVKSIISLSLWSCTSLVHTISGRVAWSECLSFNSLLWLVILYTPYTRQSCIWIYVYGIILGDVGKETVQKLLQLLCGARIACFGFCDQIRYQKIKPSQRTAVPRYNVLWYCTVLIQWQCLSVCLSVGGSDTLAGWIG